MDKLNELQELCKEIAIYYTTQRNMKEYGKLAIALIGRQNDKEKLENKLQNLEIVLKDTEVPQPTIDKAYQAYSILANILKVRTKKLTYFRKELKKPEESTIKQAKQYPLNDIIETTKTTLTPLEEKEEAKNKAYEKLQKTVADELARIEKKPETKKKPKELKDIVEELGAEIIELAPIETKTLAQSKIKKSYKRPKPRIPRNKVRKGLAIPIAIIASTFMINTLIFGKLYTKIKSIEKDNKEKQKLCEYIVNKKTVKLLANKLNGQILYAEDLSKILNKEIKPGEYKLSELFSCFGKEDMINYLNNSEIKVKKRRKPFNNPLDGKSVLSCYFGQTGRILGGKVSNKPHSGVDLCGITNRHIYAAGDGIVCEVTKHYTPRVGYGKKIIIKHEKLKTLYAHLSKIYVSEGDSVHEGDLIAEEGATGHAYGKHLHFEVRKNGIPVNPVWYYERYPSAQDVKENNSDAYIIYKILNND